MSVRAKDEVLSGDSNARDEGLLTYAVVIWRHSGGIALLCVIALLATWGITAFMPKYYASTATLVAPKESGGGSLLGGLASSVLIQQMPGLSLPSLSPNRDLLVSVLKSRTVAEAVVARFGLRERYRARYLEDAI